jgi:hypothetical protein
MADIIVIGGGAYGTYHARQLLKACHAGKLGEARVVGVDRNPVCQASRELAADPLYTFAVADWSQYLHTFLACAQPGDYIVPAPFTPNLLYHWLADALRERLGEGAVTAVDATTHVGTPVDILVSNGQRALSYATWMCPTTCIEPAACPAIKGPRDWDMAPAVERLPLDPASGITDVAVFTAYHLAYGVAAVPVQTLLDARDRLAGAARLGPRTVAVATVSHCHGLMGMLRLGALQG